MAKRNEWRIWLKCNVIETIILIFVLVLVIKAFSGPVPTEINDVQIIEEPGGILEEATNVAEVINATITEVIKTNETTGAEETNNQSIKK